MKGLYLANTTARSDSLRLGEVQITPSMLHRNTSVQGMAVCTTEGVWPFQEPSGERQQDCESSLQLSQELCRQMPSASPSPAPVLPPCSTCCTLCYHILVLCQYRDSGDVVIFFTSRCFIAGLLHHDPDMGSVCDQMQFTLKINYQFKESLPNA